MRLILSSCDFSNTQARQCIIDHLPRRLSQCKVLFVPNERATSEKIRSGKFHRRLEELGFSGELIWVFDPACVNDFIGLDIDVIYISGGNTFQTLQKLRACGFVREIVRYIEQGVVYIGGSAGAHIVTQNIEHVAEYDAVPQDMTDFSGLGLFHGILLCHFTEERRAHYEKLLAEGHYSVYGLRDEDSIVIDDTFEGEKKQ